jgi:cytochrome c-type biogenesis protein
MSLTILLSAFGAGVASFLSPCVLPLVPVYVAQLVGPSVWQAQRSGGTAGAPSAVAATEGAPLRLDTLVHASAFVAGFGLAFVALGASASALGTLLAQHQEALRRVGGVALVLFGLHVAGVVQIPGLQREHRFSLRTGKPGYITSVGLGLVFAIGWTPCVGPFLASILVLAAQAGTLTAGVLLLAAYSLGLGLPFLLVGAGFDRVGPLIKRLGPHVETVERVAGTLLVVLGIVIIFNWLLIINSWFILPR